jgi:TatD DNase family protein
LRWIDTHLHLDDEQFSGQREEVIARAVAAGVDTLLVVGTSVESSQAVLELARQHQPLFAAVGIHPNYCHEATTTDWQVIENLAKQPRVVALGETGLDCYWDHAPLATQQDYFDRHLRLSQTSGLPFVVHLRNSEEEVLAMLREARRRGPLKGVMHSFTASPDAARECLDMGIYLSFAGMLTFKKSEALREIAAGVPADRLLLETDAPYLSPAPHRGKRPNEPAWLLHTAQCLAAVRGISQEELSRLTTANAERLFQFD